MFDKFRLKEVLVEYKKRFVQQQWLNEKYKWEAVQCFQLNWDVNSDDFAQMLTKSLAQTANLLASVNNFPARMITKFAEIAPEEVRSMYIELYDESKDLYERVASFKNKSNTLLERYGNGAAQHYQYENAIMTYLWLRYPNKYYIYKLSEGLYREYISRQEELSVMRGKINMPGTIKNRLAHKRELTCDFDELSENNLLNQILKTTVTLLLRNGKVQAKYKDDLKKKMLYFSNVEIIEPTGIKWSSIRFQRNNQTYRMLVSICQLIIEGMLITTDSGDYRLASFVDEQRMCRLYEKFILEYYSRHYPELSVSASQIPWSLDDGIGTMLPVMQSDIHLQRGNG